MTARTEEELAVLVAERSAVRIGSYRIGGGKLLTQRYIDFNAEILLDFRHYGGNLLLKSSPMCRRYCKVQVYFSIGLTC